MTTTRLVGGYRTRLTGCPPFLIDVLIFLDDNKILHRRFVLRGFLIRWILNMVALWLVSWVIRGIEVSGVLSLVFASIVLGILNAILRPLIVFLTLPINILTFGLFTFVINGFMLWITGRVVEGFEVSGFFPAFIGAILLTVISTILSFFIGDRGRIEVLITRR